MVEAGDVYRHFKGTEYVIIGRAKCSETKDALILYAEILNLDDPALIDHALAWEKTPLWSRPEKMFTEIITRGGKTFPRFERVEG